MRTTIDIINLFPAYALEMDVLKRMWTEKDINYKHAKVFRCPALAHIPKDERSKHHGKVRSCIYLENSQEQFSYRLWDLEDKKVLSEVEMYFFF